ncbi:MAG: hypothetical protein MESAZ_01123 [Saezia sanguinis]
MGAVQKLIESAVFQRFIIVVIVINAITLGFETSPALMAGAAGPVLVTLDHLALGIFIVEIVLKLLVYRHRFFFSGWNVFDFLVVGITLVPAGAGLSVLRALRILRALRLVSTVPAMRKVVNALLRAIPGISSVMALLLLIFYIAAVMATKLFGEQFPVLFGNLGSSLFTLFQIMTLDSWATGVTRPIMAAYPWAWVFFVLFVLVATFAVLNLFIAIMVDTMHEADHEEQEETREVVKSENELLMDELRSLRSEMAELRQAMGQAGCQPRGQQQGTES